MTNAGGLGFLPAGLSSAEDLADAIVATRRLTSGPIGVNLFVRQRSAGKPERLAPFAAALAEEAERYGVALGEPDGADNEWPAQLDVVCDLRPEVVSFTFGSPSDDECRRLQRVGILTLGTITSIREAMIALSAGVDALVAQGPGAGGHRATFDALALPPSHPLEDLVSALVACFDCPVVAAGDWEQLAMLAGFAPPVPLRCNSAPRSCAPTRPEPIRCIGLLCAIRGSPKRW